MYNHPQLITFYIADLLRGYGSEQIAVQLLNGLAKKGYAVDLIVNIAGGSIAKTIDSRINQIEIGTRSPITSVLFLHRYLRENKPQVFFTCMEKPSLIGIIASFFSRYKNIIPSIHFDINAYANLEHSARRKILRLLIAVFYRYAPCVVAVSNGARNALQPWLGSHTPVKTIYNGFDLVNIRKSIAEPVAFPWLTRKTIPVFISCGRMVPLKAFDILLKAFAKLRIDQPARLIILGEGEMKKNLQELAIDLGISEDVAMPGFVNNPISWFALSDCFVLSSRTEALPNVLIEALISETKIVSTNCPSGPIEVLDEGKYGQLVPVDDIPAIAAAMQEAVKRKAQISTQRQEIRNYIDKQFSLDGMVEAYIAVAGLS